MPTDPHDLAATPVDLHAQQIFARRLVANPTPHQSAALRALAWAVAKHAFGQRVIQSRLPHASWQGGAA